MTCIPSLEKDPYFQNHGSYVSHGQTVAQRLPINMSSDGRLAIRSETLSSLGGCVYLFVYVVDIPTPFFSPCQAFLLSIAGAFSSTVLPLDPCHCCV